MYSPGAYHSPPNNGDLLHLFFCIFPSLILSFRFYTEGQTAIIQALRLKVPFSRRAAFLLKKFSAKQ
jgi:hypothetical protein